MAHGSAASLLSGWVAIFSTTRATCAYWITCLLELEYLFYPNYQEIVPEHDANPCLWTGKDSRMQCLRDTPTLLYSQRCGFENPFQHSVPFQW